MSILREALTQVGREALDILAIITWNDGKMINSEATLFEELKI